MKTIFDPCYSLTCYARAKKRRHADIRDSFRRMGRRYPDALERIQRVMVRPVTGGGAYRSYFLDAPAMALFLKWRGEPMERMSIYTVEGPFDRGGGKRADLFVNPLGFELLATEGEDDPKVA